MANLNIQMLFLCEMSSREFSVMTMALAGRKLEGADLKVAKNLNKRLLEARQSQIKDYARESLRAMKIANNEMNELLKAHPELDDEAVEEELENVTG
jgi:hypothetical protein